ncbi:hypothetical protein Tco_1268605, partial [Tanacetum coccineum]
MAAKQLQDIHNFKQEGDESLYQAWERSSRKDGLAALVNKLDNLGRDMKKLKESVHAIQVGCQIYEGPHLDKDCSLNEEVKQVKEEAKLRRAIGQASRGICLKSTEMEVWIKKLQENAEINTRNQSASLKNLETQIEQITEELCSRMEKSEQAKVVIVEHEEPDSSKKLKNLHGISFLSDSQEEKSMINYLQRNLIQDILRFPAPSFTEALDPDKDPLKRCFDEYNWVFHKEIEQLADEYEIKIGEKGQDEEKTELGREDYNSPVVHAETFEVTMYKYDNGCSFICVSDENYETLSLGRKNGSRFRKMIMKEMEEVLGNDGEDSDDETIQKLG